MNCTSPMWDTKTKHIRNHLHDQKTPMLPVIQSFSYFVSKRVLGYMHFWDNTGWGCGFYGNELYKIQIMSTAFQEHYCPLLLKWKYNHFQVLRHICFSPHEGIGNLKIHVYLEITLWKLLTAYVKTSSMTHCILASLTTYNTNSENLNSVALTVC